MEAELLAQVAAEGLEVAPLVAATGDSDGREDVGGNPLAGEGAAEILEAMVLIFLAHALQGEADLAHQLLFGRFLAQNSLPGRFFIAAAARSTSPQVGESIVAE